jgi:hypothetical protein
MIKNYSVGIRVYDTECAAYCSVVPQVQMIGHAHAHKIGIFLDFYYEGK